MNSMRPVGRTPRWSSSGISGVLKCVAECYFVVITLSFTLSIPNGVLSLQACESWERLADQMRHFENHTGHIKCETVDCSGVNCAGYLQENFTLGVYIDPCQSPPGVQVHGSVPSLHGYTPEKPWSRTFYPNGTAPPFFIPGAKLVIAGVEMDVYLMVTVTRFPNASMDVDLTLKSCYGGDSAIADELSGNENCTTAETILKSGPVKVPPCHVKSTEAEIHSAKAHLSPVIPTDVQDYNSGAIFPSTLLPRATSPPTPATTTTVFTESPISGAEKKWSRPCSPKDLRNFFPCSTPNNEVCSQVLSNGEGLCVCQVGFVRSEHGVCVISSLDSNGDARRANAMDSEDEEDHNGAAPASSSHYSGTTDDSGERTEHGHGGAVAAGILIPLFLIIAALGSFMAYRRGFCPPKSLHQPLRISLSRFSVNRSPGMVLIGDGDEEATA